MAWWLCGSHTVPSGGARCLGAGGCTLHLSVAFSEAESLAVAESGMGRRFLSLGVAESQAEGAAEAERFLCGIGLRDTLPSTSSAVLQNLRRQEFHIQSRSVPLRGFVGFQPRDSHDLQKTANQHQRPPTGLLR